MVTKSIISFIVSYFLIFLINTYGLQNVDSQLILDSESNPFTRTTQNTSDFVNRYQMAKHLDFNMATPLTILKVNRVTKVQGHIHGDDSQHKQQQLNLNKRLFSKTERKKIRAGSKENMILKDEILDGQKVFGVMDRLWSAMNYGSLTELHERKPETRSLPPDANYWTLIKKKVYSGVLFVEIGGCLTASHVADDWGSSSVVVSLLLKGLYNGCLAHSREFHSRNFLIGSVSHAQEMVESLSSDQTVAVENLLLSDLQVLWQSLLPHECEDLVSKLLALSWRVYIVNPSVRSGYVVPYTDWWPNLKTFLKICCQKRNLHCAIDLLNGTDSWESLAVYQVTVESGYRPVISVNKPSNNSKKQQQSVPLKTSNTYLRQDTGKRIDSQTNNGYSFPILSKGVSLSRESLELVFLICLQMPATEWNQMTHLPFFTLKPFHLHIYRPDPLKMLIKTGTSKYTKVSEIYQTVRPRHTPDFDELGEFWDREIFVSNQYKLGNDREVAISNAFWDRDGSFLESKVKNEKPLLWNNIWNKDEFEESLQYNDGPYKSSDTFQKLDLDFPFHNSKRNFQWRFFHDTTLPYMRKGIPGTRQRSSTEITQNVFTKFPLFQNVQKMSSFSFPGKRILNNKGMKFIIPIKKAKLKNLNKKLNDIRRNSVLNKNNMKQNFYVKKKIFLNKMNTNISKMIQHPKVQHKDLRKLTWNNDHFKWILQQFHPVQSNFRIPMHKLVKHFPMKETKFIKINDQVKKTTFPSKMSFSYRKSKLGQAKIKEEFNLDKLREELTSDYGMKNIFQDLLKRKGTKMVPETNQAQENKKMEGIDERLYQSQWNAVKLFFKRRLNGNFSLLVYGSRHLTLLAAKTGLLYPHSTILNIVPTFDATFANRYRHILSPNVLTVFNNLDKEIVNTISHLPNLFTFQILGMDIFAKIVLLNEGFIEYLGNILSLAQVSIFIVPKQEQFLFAQRILRNTNGTGEKNKDFSFKKLILKAAAVIGAKLDLRIIKADDFDGSLLFAELKHLKKEVVVDCTHGKGTLIFESVSPAHAYLQTAKSLIYFDTKIIVLSFLLALDLRATERRKLLLHYLQLPIFLDMCPHLIFWSSRGLLHSHQRTQTEQSHEQTLSDSSLKMLVRIFTKQLHESPMPFSFLEYQSEGSLISQLSRLFPNSSFIAVMQDEQRANSFHQKVDANNLENLLVTQHDVDDIFTQKLLRSPEFFRYQFMGYKSFLNLASTLSRNKFNMMMGQLLSVSVSSFLMLPSEKILSLAMLTFYPEFHSDQWNERDHNSAKNSYLSDNHPLSFYKNAERKIISESARADVHAEVEAITSQYFQLREGNLFPWRLLQVNIKNLTTQVEHHFESYLDGHTRTYIQRCTSFGSNHYEVHLQRQSDGLIIPYGNVHAITLIALFRMGLLAEIQKKLYHQFLKLPLYEDMAPWNIVFSAGQLKYIDFDTRNKTFDSVVPMAYQIMSVLMNYERTIKDFGKCKGQAKTQFGFGFISSCVGSDFLGPCKDPRTPVPCGDFTCRSTYVECLQALAKAEEGTKRKKQLKSV